MLIILLSTRGLLLALRFIFYLLLSETPPAGAGGIFNVTSKLGGLQPSRYISRQESGVLCG
jgi:hypothetical protein